MVNLEILIKLSIDLGNILRQKNKKIAFAESCTGGLLSFIITEVSGSSDYFDRGFVTYSNESKIQMLGVKKEIIEKYGAVSFECAKDMVEKLRKKSSCEICVSITGIAGPTGGTEEKPVGLVYTGFYIDNFLKIEKNIFTGTRGEIRMKTAKYVLEYILNSLK